RFPDSYLSKVLRSGYNQVSGEIGSGLNTPKALRDVEVAGINQSRIAKTCTFNEFRAHFNLMPLKKFSDFSDKPEVQQALEELYEHVDNVELFAGLMVERSVPSGLRLPYTMKRAILSDAVNLLRNDRILTQSFTPTYLTSWGAMYSEGNPEDHGRVLPTMLNLLLPKGFTDDELSNIFVAPEAAPYKN
ncbi:hypothetical protein DFQ28_003242, partial [Apophysomyces sp. BC1034]